MWHYARQPTGCNPSWKLRLHSTCLHEPIFQWNLWQCKYIIFYLKSSVRLYMLTHSYWVKLHLIQKSCSSCYELTLNFMYLENTSESMSLVMWFYLIYCMFRIPQLYFCYVCSHILQVTLYSSKEKLFTFSYTKTWPTIIILHYRRYIYIYKVVGWEAGGVREGCGLSPWQKIPEAVVLL